MTEVITSAEMAGKRLTSLARRCETLSLASAWATMTGVVRQAFKNPSKIEHMVFGTSDCLTGVDVLKKGMTLKQFKIRGPRGKLFHPKVYVFHFHRHTNVFVGSNNLTRMGLGSNYECGVVLKGDLGDPAIRKLVKYVEDQWKLGQVCKPDFIDQYEANIKRNKKAKKGNGPDWVWPKEPKPSAEYPDLQMYSWKEYLQAIKSRDGGPALDERLRILALTHRWFEKSKPFADFSLQERKNLAGTLKDARIDDPEWGRSVDWGYFGNMVGAGKFVELVIERPAALSKALDEIPFTGEVTKTHFDAFVKIFRRARSEITDGWLSTSTRLLAMKRPDTFVCISNPNKKNLGDAFGTSYTQLNLKNYWNDIIEPMRLTPWYRAPRPNGGMAREIWDGRAAMMDAICYVYKPRKKRVVQ